MPYADPDKRRKAKRESARRRRQVEAAGKVVQLVTEHAAEIPTVLPDPPSVDELERILGVQARLGSVQAAKLLLDRLEKENGGDIKPESVIADLAKRRKDRAARAG